MDTTDQLRNVKDFSQLLAKYVSNVMNVAGLVKEGGEKMRKSNGDNPMKNVHPYDVTAFYFANLKEDEMTDEEKLKDIKELDNKIDGGEFIDDRVIAHFRNNTKFLLDLVERLKKEVDKHLKQARWATGQVSSLERKLRRIRNIATNPIETPEADSKIQQLETILEKAEIFVHEWDTHKSMLHNSIIQWIGSNVNVLKQAIADYKKGEK